MTKQEKPIESLRFTRVDFHNFKSLAGLTLPLEGMNILLGSNNAGKSTALDAFRVLAAGLRGARVKSPNAVTLTPRGNRQVGWAVSVDDLPFSIENVHTDYNNRPAHVVFTLSNESALGLTFPPDGGCILYAEPKEARPPQTPSAFREAFPVTVGVVPVLGPVEHEEPLFEKSTVVRGLATHRASRHFRSAWYHFPERFEEFAEHVRRTWPGMSISTPELVTGPARAWLIMFCSEDRIDRELYWVGFGFQIWCQLLTHIVRNKDATLLVLDEPETYLHPDVQRKLVGILRGAGPSVLVATHSSEIIAEAEPHELVLINKQEKRAVRLADVAHVQRVLGRIGSLQNVTLTHLSRTRKVLFAHAEDHRVLRLAAARLGRTELEHGSDYTVLPVARDFRASTAVEVVALLSETLGMPIVGAVLGPRAAAGDADTSLAVVSRYAGTELVDELLTPEVLDVAFRSAMRRRPRQPEKTAIAARAVVQSILANSSSGGGFEPQFEVLNRRLAEASGITILVSEVVEAAHIDAIRAFATKYLQDLTKLRGIRLGKIPAS